ncbi:MAG: AI-2E family transporter [Armatimonadetes bacterium]|nr:AI-2E family transporter [Armatimonadota bacterium]
MRASPWYYVSIVLLVLVVIAALILAGAFLLAVRGVLPPFIIAFIIAWLLDPLLVRLQKHKVPRIVAVAGVYIVFLAFFVLGILFIVPIVVKQAQDLARDIPHQYARFQDFLTAFMQKHQSLLERLQLPTTLQEAFSRYSSRIAPITRSAIQALSHWLLENLSKAVWLILIPLSAFYFLNDMERIRSKSVLIVPKRYRARVTEIASRVGQVFSSYVRGLIIVCLLYSIGTTVILAAIGLKYGIILGLLAGVLYAVPYVGAITITLLVFLVGLATYPQGAFAHAVFAGLLMVVLNQTFDLVITPRILGKSVGLHPVLGLMALVAGGQLFGIVGMILAVPVVASIQEVVFEFFPELKVKENKKRKSHENSKKQG